MASGGGPSSRSKRTKSGHRRGGVLHALQRARQKGLITRKQAKKARKTIKRSRSGATRTNARATAAGTFGAGGSLAQRGAAISANTRSVRQSRRAFNRKMTAAGVSPRVGVYSGTKYSKPKATTAPASGTRPRSNYKQKVDKVAAKVTARAAASGKYAAPRSAKSARAQARKIIKARKK